MILISMRDKAQEAIDRLTRRLMRDFPDEQGRHAVIFSQGPDVDLGAKHYQWPPVDNRPDFVKADDEGWVRLK